jgi:hypothetical protein
MKVRAKEAAARIPSTTVVGMNSKVYDPVPPAAQLQPIDFGQQKAQG